MDAYEILKARQVLMINQLAEKLRSMFGNRTPFDPSVFNDPLAMQIQWGPLKGGGSNFRTHKLVSITPSRIQFRTAPEAMVFNLVFLFVGLGMLAGLSAPHFLSEQAALNGQTVLPLIVAAVFSCVGIMLCCRATLPIVFDRTNGYFWKGRKAPEEVLHIEELKCATPLSEIYAIQLVSELCSGNKSSYYSYELNLVLKNGERLNVIDHGHQKKLRLDAEQLASFLQVPLWDSMRPARRG